MNPKELQLTVARLKQIASIRGLTQAELADKANLSQSQISRLWSAETRLPSPRTLDKIAVALETNIVEVLKSVLTLPQEEEPSWLREVDPIRLYSTAKVLLVGDGGVGKSGLIHRLAENNFVQTESTEGLWATQIKLPYDVNVENATREIWLWDFAGHSDYRLTHKLFLDQAAIVVLVFNPQMDNPFEELARWDRDLQKAANHPLKKLLVAGRCDRGRPTVNRKSIDNFIYERGFAGYLETSSLTGAGFEELRDAIITNINWNEVPSTSSPRIFNTLKEVILDLKDEGRVLLRLSELKQMIRERLFYESFTFDEIKPVVRLLASSGIVWELGFGDFVLLQPEKINAYARAVMRSVRSNVDEMGSISEEKVLTGELEYGDEDRLNRFEEEIVLRAMLQAFVARGLCVRESSDAGIILVFPSYFRRERPTLETHPSAFVTYQFTGMLDEIYSTLIVKLHHTAAFEKDQLWRDAADFRTQTGRRVGLKISRKHDELADISVYFENDIPDDTKAIFIRYVQDHLKASDKNTIRIRHYFCPQCGEPFENDRAVRIRLNNGMKDIMCPICETRFALWDWIEEKFASEEFRQRVRQMEEQSKTYINNATRELIMIGHASAIAGEAGQIFRQISNSNWDIDGEIEFKDYEGNASGKVVYLQLKSSDSYLRKRNSDKKEIFQMEPFPADYWKVHNRDVMLVICSSDGSVRWMNITEYLKKRDGEIKQIIFEGEPFTASNLKRFRNRLLPKQNKKNRERRG